MKPVLRNAGALAVVLLLAFPNCNGNRAHAATGFFHFTTTDQSYLNAEAASTMAELVQIAVQHDASIDWVDRDQIEKVIQELQLTNSGVSDFTTPLQLGRLLKADILVKGTFFPDAKESWRFDLEIIELKRADVLVQSAFRVDRQSLPKLAVTDVLVTAIAKRLRGLLSDAIARRERIPQQLLVAPVHFQNIHENTRLDFLENDLQRNFEERNKQQRTYRYLQFPKSHDAIAEATLVDSGLVENVPNGHAGIADCYVWGTYQETNGSGVPFNDVSIEFTLHYWDGGNKRAEESFQGTVGNRDELLRNIISHVESIAEKNHQRVFNHDVRKQIAELFYQRAVSRRFDTIQTEMRDASHVTASWMRLWRQTSRLLSTAVFFDPANEIICREFLVETTREDVSPDEMPETNTLNWLWQRHLAWSRHAGSFGLNHELIRNHTFRDRPGSLTDNRLFRGHFAMTYMYTTLDLLKYIQKELTALGKHRDRSTDVPADVLKQWQVQLTGRYLSQLNDIAERDARMLKFSVFWLLSDMHNLDSSQSKARLLEIAWPLAVKNEGFDGQRFRSDIQRIYADLGKPEMADSMLAALGKEVAPAKIKRTVPMRKDATPSFAVERKPIAKIASVPMQTYSVQKLWFVHQVTALTFAGDQLWCAFSGQKYDQELTPGNGLFSWDSRNEKWLTWNGLNRHSSRVTRLMEIDGYLWTAFVGDDVCRMHLESGETQRFTARDGVPSNELHDLCRIGQTVYAGGGRARHGVLGSYDLLAKQWTQYDLGQCELRGRTYAFPRVTRLAANADWVAICAHWHGSNRQLILMDRSDVNVRIDVCQIIAQLPGAFSHNDDSSRPEVHAMAFHNRILWIATERGLLAFDPTVRKIIYAESLNYQLTSLAMDGDQIWFGASPFRERGELKDAEDEACLLQFDIGAKAWLAQIPVPHPGQLLKIHRTNNTLWLGTGIKQATAVAADLSALRNSPE
jgi:hypothetical protein